jgi:hypothetical protein
VAVLHRVYVATGVFAGAGIVARPNLSHPRANSKSISVNPQ